MSAQAQELEILLTLFVGDKCVPPVVRIKNEHLWRLHIYL